MSVEEQQVSHGRATPAVEPNLRAGAASGPASATAHGPSSTLLAVAGLSVVQPQVAPQPFAARWFRAWEGDLHRQAVRKTGRRHWDLTRFGVDGEPQESKLGYRETLAAVGLAAKQALAAADARCGRRGVRERLALLYFDFWGQCAHLEQAFNWRDGFDLDVIPKFLLRDHGVDGYSCKLQAGRAAFVQGLRAAGELLHGGDIDRVLLGGVFRFYPALGFSEAIGNVERERRWLGRGGQHNAPIVERAGFVVLTRAQAAAGAKTAPVLIGAPQYLALPARRAAASAALSTAWSALLPESRGRVYGGLYPSSLLADMENAAAASQGDELLYENICRRFGDSGGINPLLALQRYAERKAGADQALPALLSLSDSSGGTWLARCE
ncbi:MAG: hypothetical protein V4812_00745 [Pseudomonadota bacterium]